MTREEAKELLPIIQAFADGKTIQIKKEGDWLEVGENTEVYFSESPSDYRIKPEPKYRPFKTQEECWNEMLKHQPFGWIYSKNESCYYCIISVEEDRIELSPQMQSHYEEPPKEYYLEKDYYLFDITLEPIEFTFADGAPFGSYGGMIMTVAEYIRLVTHISILKEIAMEYPAKTIDDIIVQMEARRKEIGNSAAKQ